MPQVENHPQRGQSSWLLWTGLGVGVLVLGVAVTLVLIAIVGLGQSQAARYQSTWNQAQTLDNENKHAQEQTLLESYIKTNPPEKYRYEPEIRLGDLAFNVKDDATALSWYEKAQATVGHPGMADQSGEAEANEAMGNKQAAISNYQEVIKLVQASTSYRQDIPAEVAQYQENINYLEGKQ